MSQKRFQFKIFILLKISFSFWFKDIFNIYVIYLSILLKDHILMKLILNQLFYHQFHLLTNKSLILFFFLKIFFFCLIINIRTGCRPFVDIYDQDQNKIFSTYQETTKLRLEFNFILLILFIYLFYLKSLFIIR